MTTSSTTQGFPFPNSDDPVRLGAQRIQELAQAVDTKAGVSAGGVGTLQITGAVTGQVVVTLPAGRFVATPGAVVVSAKDSSIFSVSSATYTATTFTVTGRRIDGTSTTVGVTFSWIAHS